MGICRKTLCIILASLFVFSAFAAPGGGGGGGGGGRGGGGPSGGRGSGPGSRGGSFGSRSPGGMGPSGGISPSGGSRSSANSGRKSDSSNSVRASQPQSPSPSTQVGPSPSVFPNGSSPDEVAQIPDSSTERIIPEMINYRGNRIASEGSEFFLQNIKSERTSNGEVSLEISFNQSVNPLTFSAESILIDGIAVPPKTKFSFNKKGDTIRMSVPSKSEKMNIMIQNVESFDGTVIAPVQIELK